MLPITKYDKELNTLFINAPERGLKVVIDGDLSLTLNGEISLITHNENVCIDTIGGKIFLNSRQGKEIKDLPESKEYRENIKKKMEEMDKCNKHKHLESCPLKENIYNLEDRIMKLERLLEEKCQE